LKAYFCNHPNVSGMQKICGILLVTLALFVQAIAQPTPQNRAELERKRQELQREMDEVKEHLKEIKGNTKRTLAEATLLQRKIQLKNDVINNISQELRYIDDDIYNSNIEIYRQKKEIDTLKAQYARSIVYAYKNRSNYDFLNFLFSSSSFNDAMKRISYLKTYRTYRQQQASNIHKAQDELQRKIGMLNTNKNKKGEVLTTQNKVVKELQDDKKEKDIVINSLKSRADELSNQLAKKKKQDQQLKSLIAAAIKREIAEARAIAKKRDEEEKKRLALIAKNNNNKPPVTAPENNNTPNNTPATPTRRNNKPVREGNVLEPTPEAVALSESFEANRGRLPWPIDNGYIALHYGTNAYQGSRIDIDNPAVTFNTQVGASVKSIFNGEVSSVTNMDEGVVVIIRHGKYFSAYSILASASVSRGQKISTGQMIGRAKANGDNQGEVDLMINVGEKNVNPEGWIRRK
jgi:murein hydrolase activator